jgi:ketopantoate hydroxymethyltransferase
MHFTIFTATRDVRTCSSRFAYISHLGLCPIHAQNCCFKGGIDYKMFGKRHAAEIPAVRAQCAEQEAGIWASVLFSWLNPLMQVSCEW